MGDIKTEIARRQLGTALALFIADKDPISVHVLARGAAEITEYLAKQVGEQPFSMLALSAHPKMIDKNVKYCLNQFSNAMKHCESQNGNIRDDENLLAAFDDSLNDHALFISWYDYMLVVDCLPIEVQIFQSWYSAIYFEGSLSNIGKELFPRIKDMDRVKRKKLLSRKIISAKKDHELMSDAKTEKRELILGNGGFQNYSNIA